MGLFKQVVNLELSKRLKELGVKQESLFKWSYYEKRDEMTDSYFWIVKHLSRTIGDNEYSAFTASELLEMLPNEINNSEYIYVIQKYPNEYEIRAWHKFDTMILKITFDKSLCNALAKMLIHLIEQKLIEV